MKAQCCICADLFENDQKVNIAATPCGHVFHEACLMKWMDNSSTCPSCRTHVKKTQIIKRLFFDINEDVETEEDVSHYFNKISDLKAQVKERDKSVKDLKESRDQFEALLAVSEAKQAEFATKLSRERSLIDMLKSDVDRRQKENNSYLLEIAELREKAKKVHELQNVETLLKGSSEETEEMLRQLAGGGDSSIRQLVSLQAVMKKEYNQVLSDKRAAKEQVRKLKQQIGTYQVAAREAKSEAKHLREELEMAYQNLAKKEAENNENRRKIVHLRNALHRNKTQGSQSFHQALSEDSPNVAYTPVPQEKERLHCDNTTPVKTKTGGHDQENSDTPPNKRLCLSPDLFETTPVRSKGKGRGQPDGEDLSEDVNDDRQSLPEASGKLANFRGVKKKNPFSGKGSITAQLYPSEKDDGEDEDDGPYIPPSMLHTMQMKLSGARTSSYSNENSGSSVITRGYDGFGGSTTFVHTQPRPQRGSLMWLGQANSKRKGLKKNCNIQRQPVPKSQRPIKDSIFAAAAMLNSGTVTAVKSGTVNSVSDYQPSSSSALSGSSCSSLTSSSSNKNNNKNNNDNDNDDAFTLLSRPSSFKLPSSKSTSRNLSSTASNNRKTQSLAKFGMFTSKGHSVSVASTKTSSKKENDVIDLT